MSVLCRDTPLDTYSGDRRFILSVNSRTCRADSVAFYSPRGTVFGSQHPCSMSYKPCDSSFRESGTGDILNPSVKCLFKVDSKIVLVGDSYLKCAFVIVGKLSACTGRSTSPPEALLRAICCMASRCYQLGPPSSSSDPAVTSKRISQEMHCVCVWGNSQVYDPLVKQYQCRKTFCKT